MQRFVWVLVFAVGALWFAPDQAAAAQAAKWPDFFDLANGQMQRGVGFYLSWVKLAVIWLWFLIWVSTTDWVNRDAQRHRLNYALWNPLCFSPFFASLVLVWLIPYFAVGLTLLMLAHLVPLGIYIRIRNAKLEPHLRVLTLDHLRFLAAERLRPLGIKIDARRKSLDELGPPIKLIAQGGATERDDTAHLLLARQSPGFLPAREVLAEAVARRADVVMLDFSQQAVAIRYEIDGVWQNGESRERETGDALLAVLKTVAALNANERRARQQGKFGFEFEKAKYTCSLVTQGTPTGERALAQFDDGSARFKKLADLGMREKLVEQMQQVLREPSGFILLSAPPRGGLTALTNATLGSTDRFVRSYVTIEDVARPEKVIENVPVTSYDKAAGETPLAVLPRLVRTYPDVIVLRDLVDAETVSFLCDQVAENRLILGTVRAKEAVEALLRVLLLKVPPSKFAPTALAVLNQRLIRKLCETCREAYAPTPQVLQQLRIPAGKVEAFYRPPQQPEQVCPDCAGIGYRGRTGMFELLVLNDELRRALAETPKLDVLRREARKHGFRGLQEEGILLVAKGVTSLAELQRVLKE